MNNLLLSHLWLAGLALLAPVYLLSRRAQQQAAAAPSPAQLGTAHGVHSASAAKPAVPRAAPHRLQPHMPGPRSAPALRVLSVMDQDARQGGRLRISGRMADVCAELERMAEREARGTSR